MKCELAAALLHRPSVLFLDEPTIGLDVSMQVTVREFVKAYNERFGATVLLTSHYMADVLALCPRIIVIDKGDLLFDGALQQLVHSVRPEKRIVLKLSKPVDHADALLLGNVVEHDNGKLVLQVRPENIQQAVGAAMAKLPVAEILTVEVIPCWRRCCARSVRTLAGGGDRMSVSCTFSHVPDAAPRGLPLGARLPGGVPRLGTHDEPAAHQPRALERGLARSPDRPLRPGGLRRLLPCHAHRAPPDGLLARLGTDDGDPRRRHLDAPAATGPSAGAVLGGEHRGGADARGGVGYLLR